MFDSLMKERKGSISVEASIIVPIIIIATLVLLYILLLFYQSCITHAVANSLAELTASNPQSHSINLNSGRIHKAEFENLELYRRWNMGSGDDVQPYKNIGAQMFKGFSVLKQKNLAIEINRENQIFNQKITVKVSAEYKSPFGVLGTLWGINNMFTIDANADATIDEPAEFIRNADFVLETASKIPVLNEFEAKWREMINKIINYIENHDKGDKVPYE